MKINGKSLAVSIGLLAVLLIVLLVESSIFISGPSRKYEEKIDEQMSAIRDTYKEIKNLRRDAFYTLPMWGRMRTITSGLMIKGRQSYPEKRIRSRRIR